MRAMFLVLVLLAGCATPAAEDVRDPVGDPVATRTTDGPASPTGWRILVEHGCDTTFAYATLPREQAEAAMPPGFSPASFSGEGADFAIKAWACARSVLDGVDLGASRSVVYYWLVQPPDEWRNESIEIHWLPVGLVSDNAAVLGVYRAWGFGAVAEGEVEMALHDAQAIALGRTVAGGGGIALDLATSVRSPQPGGAYVVRYIGTREGAAVGAVDIEVSSNVYASGDALVRLEGPGVPLEAPTRAVGSHRLWDDQAVSYVWRGPAELTSR